MTDKERAEIKLRNAIQRHDYFGAMPDHSAIMIDAPGGTLFELIDGPEPSMTGSGEPLTLGDLRALLND
jgi:hypothetical protein